ATAPIRALRRRAPPGCGPQARWLCCSLLNIPPWVLLVARALPAGLGASSKVSILFRHTPLTKKVAQELAGGSYTVELIRYRDLSPTVRSFEFRFTDIDRFEFEPGQSIAIEFTLEGSRHSRPYSIASPPRGDNTGGC